MKKEKIAKILLSVVALLGMNTVYSSAMHIAEGFLPSPMWIIFWFAVSAPFVIYGFKAIKVKIDQVPKAKILLAMAGAFVFILSALKIPSLTGSCSHPTGIALGAILFGPSPMAVMGLIVLLFQALLLAHGGITTLGANVFSMAIVGSFVAYYTYKWLKSAGVSSAVSVFVAAFLSDLLTYVTTSFQLAVAFPSPDGGIMASLVKFMGVFAVTQIPIAVGEAILTVIVFGILEKYSFAEVKALETGSYDAYPEGSVKSEEPKGKKIASASSGKKSPLWKKNVILLVVFFIVVFAPLAIKSGSEFGGADGIAMDIVTEIDENYQPNFEPFFEPASGEIESLLFALQAALGAGVIGFGLGRLTKKES